MLTLFDQVTDTEATGWAGVMLKTLTANAIRFEGRSDHPQSVAYIADAKRMIAAMAANGRSESEVKEALNTLKKNAIRRVHAHISSKITTTQKGQGDINVICALFKKL